MSAITLSASVPSSCCRDLLTNSVTGRPSTVRVTYAHGPAANAIRYVLIGFVSANVRMRSAGAVAAVPFPLKSITISVLSASTPFDTALHPRGTMSVSAVRALRSGWSKQGKSWFASAGTSSVYR